MAKKKESKGIFFAIIIAIVVIGALFATGILDFALGCSLPTSVYSGTYFNSGSPNTAGLNIASCGLVNTGVNYYSINYEAGFVSPIGTPQAYSTIYLASTSATAAQANAQNQGQLTSSQANSTADARQASTSTGATQQLYQTKANDELQLQNIISAAISYNNALTTPTTTIPGASTTIPTQIQPPQNLLGQFYSDLQSLYNELVAFLITPIQFSVATSQNFTVSQPFTTQISLPIPSKGQTQNTTLSTGKLVQQTYCSYFVLNNDSASLLNPQPTPVLVQGAFYNTSFSYVPSTRAILVTGGLCRSDNITYSAISGSWGKWSNWTTVANESAIAKAGITTISPNPLTTFLNGIATWFNNLLKSLGL